MILDEQGIYDKDWSWNFVSFDHDEEIGDCSKGESFGKYREIFRHEVLERRVRGTIGTCNRKPQTLFWYTTNFNYCFGIFSNKTWDFVVILIHVFSNTKKKTSTMNFMFILLCELF